MDNPLLFALVAFGAGVLSFLSPCVLPVLPSFLSYITGQSAADLRAGTARRGPVVARTLAFVLGFSTVFALIGVFVWGGAEFFEGTGWWVYLSGGVVILLGLSMIFDLFAFLNFEKRFHVELGPAKGLGALAGAALLGMAFGAGWSPCVGPTLAGIIALASNSGDALGAFFLLLAYSAGLGLPFVLAGLFLSFLMPVFDWLKRRGRIVRTVSGSLLVGIGVAMLFGRLAEISSAAARSGYAIQDLRAADSLAAGMWFGLPVLLVAALVAAWPLLRRLGGKVRDGVEPAPAASEVAEAASPAKEGVRPGKARIAVAVALAVVAMLELSGLAPYSALIAAWFTWSGA